MTRYIEQNLDTVHIYKYFIYILYNIGLEIAIFRYSYKNT